MYSHLPLHALKEAFPARFKGFWNVQEPWYIPILFKLIQPFLSEKMLDRVSVCVCVSSACVHSAHMCSV